MNFLAGIATGVILTASFFTLVEKHTVFYSNGIKDTHKEAYENGHMVKEISKDDKVIYRWKHLEKIGYEGSN